MNFERGALALVGAFVSVLIAAAWISPPATGGAAPRAALNKAEPLILTGGLAPGPVTSEAIEPVENLNNFEVAAGPAGVTAGGLYATFGRLGYDLDNVKSGTKAVPRVFLASLPEDLAQVPENKQRKALFFQTMLPLVLQVNEEILADRRQLWSLRYRTGLGEKPSAAERLWLRVMTERYGVKAGDIDALISRIDIVPPALALAQAAEESGWGTSRFAKEGNALFGQWTFSSSTGITPLKRDKGKNHRVKAFDSLIDSVRAYTMNLNSHRAYRAFRSTRQAIRRAGGPLDSRVLAGKLQKYSERGQAYVTALRGLIDFNGLSPLDDARLDDSAPGEKIASAI
ncbi:MAG: glucosaminidase domain-containing protein [Rhodospirillales bacterium]|nr:glucosaminidase domain-containing protein [Rhodospirillales bacterium]